MKKRVFTLVLALMMCLALCPNTALASGASISLDKAAYSPGETIIVTATGITQQMEDDYANIAIYEKDASHYDYMQYDRVFAGTSQLEFAAPLTPGLYELRLYKIDFEYTDEAFVMSVPFTVAMQKQSKSKTSQWAEATIEKAEEVGLVPDILEGEDLTKPITRKEFAAVCVKLYEKLSGKSAAPARENPFADTDDAEVLKAYNAGITSGIAADKFGPDIILNREQAATMLTRVFKKAFVVGWTLKEDGKYAFHYTMPPKFADDAKISDWAKPSVYFMVSHKIISGIGNNTFAPKADTPAEQAAGYANATREQALAISLRITENLGDGYAASQIVLAGTQPARPPQADGSVVGKWKSGSTGYRYNAATGRFEFGLVGTSLEYHFNDDGTFEIITSTGSGSTTRLSGDYTVSGGKIAFTYKDSKQSSDFEHTWEKGNIPPNKSLYYELDSDDTGDYLLIGSEDATPPLDAKTNETKLFMVP